MVSLFSKDSHVNRSIGICGTSLDGVHLEFNWSLDGVSLELVLEFN